MRFRSLIFVLLTLIVASTAAAAMAEGICGCLANEVRQRQCWPEPYLSADRAVATAPFAIQVANGWRKQNMLGEDHFQQGNGQLTEAGRLLVRWIRNARGNRGATRRRRATGLAARSGRCAADPVHDHRR